MAKQKGIDLANVEATGRDGRVLKEDILKFLEKSTQSVLHGKSHKEETHKPSIERPQVFTEDKTIKLTAIQKAMFRTMT